MSVTPETPEGQEVNALAFDLLGQSEAALVEAQPRVAAVQPAPFNRVTVVLADPAALAVARQRAGHTRAVAAVTRQVAGAAIRGNCAAESVIRQQVNRGSL
jgi:hypothetical protein